MADTVVEQVAERLDIPPSEARLVLNALSKLIHQQAEQEGRVRVPGIGIFAQAADDAPLQFTPDAALERVVNHRYAGMASAAAPPVADAPGAASEATAGAPPIAAKTSDAKDDDAQSSEIVSVAETMEENTPEEDTPEEDTPEEDTAAEDETETTPSVGVEDKDSAATPEAEDKEQAASASASGDAPPAADPADTAGDHADGEEQTQPVTEEATPNSAPALIGLVLALLLAAGAAWWLLTDDAAVPPETPDTAVVEPEPADETDQTSPDPAPSPAAPADGPDEAVDEVAPTAEANALADGVDPSALPSGAGTIDPALGGFALVVASVPSAEDAEAIEANYREAIANDPLPTALLVSQTGDATRYRVGIGQFATQDEALTVRDARSEVLPGDAWVLRLTPAMARN
jgi:nucleoid DNA-binding protein